MMIQTASLDLKGCVDVIGMKWILLELQIRYKLQLVQSENGRCWIWCYNCGLSVWVTYAWYIWCVWVIGLDRKALELEIQVFTPLVFWNFTRKMDFEKTIIEVVFVYLNWSTKSSIYRRWFWLGINSLGSRCIKIIIGLGSNHDKDAF